MAKERTPEQDRHARIVAFAADAETLADEAEAVLSAVRASELLGLLPWGSEQRLEPVRAAFLSLVSPAERLSLTAIVELATLMMTLLSRWTTARRVCTPADVEVLAEALRELRRLLTTATRRDVTTKPGLAPKIRELLALDGVTDVRAKTLPLDSEDMRHGFCVEAHEQLDVAEQALLKRTTSASEGEELLATSFRAIHSFKGNAGLVGLAELGRLSHALETLLDILRVSKQRPSDQQVTAMLGVIDALRHGVAAVEAGRELDATLAAAVTRALSLVMPGEPSVATPESPDVVPDALPNTSTDATTPAEGDSPTRTASNTAEHQVVRVELTKLDALVSLVGELVIAESMVTRHPLLRNADDESLTRVVHQLRRVCLDLQDVARSACMVPLSQSFLRLERLVHDLSVRLGKQARLELIGAETEVDKAIVERLVDPLVHLIRNALDHGIEPSLERERAGKPAVGLVAVQAQHVGGEVLITVRDDGRGLDRERIYKRAIETNLCDPKDPMPNDERLFELIFEPGFSTTATVTELSGRGVGLDVVKRNVTGMGGFVEARSNPSEGASIRLYIPLTLAIIEGMSVRVGTTRYTLPLSAIRSFFRPAADQIHRTPEGEELVRLRGSMMPVLRLHTVFARTPSSDNLCDGILVQVESAGRDLCLFVDEIVGQQQAVVKGMSSYLGRVRGVSGCTILGDGAVSLILDVAGLLKLASAEQKTGASSHV